MQIFWLRAVIPILFSVLLCACSTISDDATFALVTVSMPDLPPNPNNPVRRERLTAFETNLLKEFNGTLPKGYVHCVHCESVQLLDELTYVFIREDRAALDKFNRAWTTTWNEKPPPNVTMTILAPAPVGGPDCGTHSCGTSCTCISWRPCGAVPCKKKGAGPVVCCT